MLNKISELDRAQLKHEFRELYKSKGFDVCLRILFEFLVAAETLGAVMVEESEDNK